MVCGHAEYNELGFSSISNLEVGDPGPSKMAENGAFFANILHNPYKEWVSSFEKW